MGGDLAGLPYMRSLLVVVNRKQRTTILKGGARQTENQASVRRVELRSDEGGVTLSTFGFSEPASGSGANSAKSGWLARNFWLVVGFVGIALSLGLAYWAAH
jgi:hypothetical protein